MKIKMVHNLCGREVLVQQLRQSGGHCPWDGKAFSADYTALLAEALETAETSGGVLENALEKLAGMDAQLTVDPDSLIRPLQVQVDGLNRRNGRRART